MAKAPTASLLKATIIELLNDGTNGQPWRAIAADDQRCKVLITSQTPIDANQGDDVCLEGVAMSPADGPIPAEFIVGEVNPAHNRFAEIAKAGATMRQFGAETATGTPRPGEIAWTRSGIKRKGELRKVPGGMVIPAATKSDNAIINWGLELFKDVKLQTPMAVIDPFKFAMSAPASGVTGKAQEQETARRAFRILAESMPQDASYAYGQKIVDMLVKCSGVAWIFGNPPDMAGRHYHRSPILAFNAVETSAFDFQYLTKLSSASFYPRTCPAPEIRWRHTIAHELAHGTQRQFGLSKEEKAGKPNLHECYADSFATFTLMKAGMGEDYMRTLAKMRDAEGLVWDIHHYSGRAIEAAMEKARAWRASGKLQQMTSEDFLNESVKLARKHAISKEVMDKAVADRSAFFKKHGLPLLEDGGVSRKHSARAYLLAKQALAEDPSQLGSARKFVADAVASIEAVAYTPDELVSSRTRKRIAQLYSQDVAQMMGAFSYNPNFANALLLREKQRMREALGAGSFQYTPKQAPDTSRKAIQGKALLKNQLNQIERVVRAIPKQGKDPITEQGRAVVNILSDHRNEVLAKAMGQSREERLAGLGAHLQGSIKACTKAAKTRSPADLAAANQAVHDLRDHLLAIHIDSDTRAEARKTLPEAVTNWITTVATGTHKPLTLKSLATRTDALKQVLKLSQQTAAPTTKPGKA